MRRVMIQADEELLDRARRVAAERGVSVAQVVRDALLREIGDPAEQLPPALTSLGIGASATGDLSRRAAADEYEPPPSRT